ncbi:MAG TPA: hypothetical protein DGP39_02870 [Verrucomicrobiales bacterium]|nr:hypothetical protein [Verrucomicrobiales bacterium]
MKLALLLMIGLALRCEVTPSTNSTAQTTAVAFPPARTKALKFPENGILRKKLPAPTSSVTVAGDQEVFHS